MNIWAKLFYRFRKIIKALKLYFIIAGPGLIVMLADNDAGGITTYAVTGAKYKYELLWFILLLLPVAYFVQEMTVRLGAVTKKGHAESIFYGFGPFWGWFSLIDLILTDWLTLVTEFIGMTAALSIFHIPPFITVLVVAIIMFLMVLQGSYWTWEKIAFLFCAFNLVYIPAAFIVNPTVSQVLSGTFIPSIPGGKFSNEIFFFLMANIGTTIAPWMIFFQQSAVVDKGMLEKDIPWGKVDTFVGSTFTVLIAMFCIVTTGTALFGHAGANEIQSAADAAHYFLSHGNNHLGTLLAIGLFDAGFLGAICISLASSWAFGEVFGWAHSLNLKIKEAPWFYITYMFALLTAGGVVLIPNAPLGIITLFVQVLAVTLLPAALVFLLILLNDKKIMGKYANTLTQNIINFTIVGLIIIVSTLYAVTTIFPHIF
ncbi:MAG: divalent metal cation transporter [Bacteroidota bacterium]|nr:divalent metal cation transporter [Bacteroidota bacterium]